jgi:hypothetical protein
VQFFLLELVVALNLGHITASVWFLGSAADVYLARSVAFPYTVSRLSGLPSEQIKTGRAN